MRRRRSVGATRTETAAFINALRDVLGLGPIPNTSNERGERAEEWIARCAPGYPGASPQALTGRVPRRRSEFI